MEFFNNRYDWLRAVMADDSLSAVDKNVAWAIQEFLSPDGDTKNFCWPNVTHIGEKLNMRPNNVSRHTQNLVAAGYLVVSRKKLVGGVVSNGYFTTRPIHHPESSIHHHESWDHHHDDVTESLTESLTESFIDRPSGGTTSRKNRHIKFGALK